METTNLRGIPRMRAEAKGKLGLVMLPHCLPRLEGLMYLFTHCLPSRTEQIENNLEEFFDIHFWIQIDRSKVSVKPGFVQHRVLRTSSIVLELDWIYSIIHFFRLFYEYKKDLFTLNWMTIKKGQKRTLYSTLKQFPAIQNRDCKSDGESKY